MQNADNPKAQRMGIVYSALLTHLRAEFDDDADPGETVRAPAVDAAALPSEAICDIATDIDDLLTGSGMRELKAAMMKGSGLDQAANPVAALKSRMNAIAKGSFVGTIVTGMDCLRVGKEGERSGPPDLDKTPTGFDLDLVREVAYDPHYITVQMDDGTTVSPTTPKEARDALVRFITGDPNAEFELVRDDKLKTKVHLLMCCMHQAAGADIAKAFGTAFDSKGVKSPFASGGGQVDTIQKFTVSKDEKGAITVNFRLHSISPSIALLMPRTKFDGLATTEQDATLDASMEVTFSPENFNELASADWAHLDTDDLRNAEKSDKPHKFATLPNKVKEQYRFTGDVRTSFSLHAETLDIHTY